MQDIALRSDGLMAVALSLGHGLAFGDGVLTDDAVVMGGAGRFDLEFGCFGQLDQFVKAGLDFVGVEHLMVGDFLAATDRHEQEIVHGLGVDRLGKAQDGFELMGVVPGDGAVDLGADGGLMQVTQGVQG